MPVRVTENSAVSAGAIYVLKHLSMPATADVPPGYGFTFEPRQPAEELMAIV